MQKKACCFEQQTFFLKDFRRQNVNSRPVFAKGVPAYFCYTGKDSRALTPVHPRNCRIIKQQSITKNVFQTQVS
jgi:hypothetical protein